MTWSMRMVGFSYVNARACAGALALSGLVVEKEVFGAGWGARGTCQTRRARWRLRHLSAGRPAPARRGLAPIDDDLLAAAETLPPTPVGALDAIHLGTPVRLSSAGAARRSHDDARLGEGARHHGLTVLVPK